MIIKRSEFKKQHNNEQEENQPNKTPKQPFSVLVSMGFLLLLVRGRRVCIGLVV